jgi:hypothetical protein
VAVTPLVYFTVTADYVAATTDGADPNNYPDMQGVSALVTFTANHREVSTPDIRLILPPIVGRLEEDGTLHTLDGEAGVALVANSGIGLQPGQLTYRVEFSRVVYDGGERTLEPFSFVAPATATTVRLENVERLPA